MESSAKILKIMFGAVCAYALITCAVNAANGPPSPRVAVVARDSAGLKSREESWFLKYADRSLYPACVVSDYSDKVLVLTVNANQWNLQSDQDKTLTERGLYAQWAHDYIVNHPKASDHTGYLVRIVDLAGTRLAEYY
jgi:hypothetical protein